MDKTMYHSQEVHGSGDINSVANDWWHKKGNETATCVFNAVNQILQQTDLKTQFVKNAMFYSSQNILNYTHDLDVQAKSNVPRYKPKYNLIKSATDSLANRIGKARPRPYFLTTKGKYEQKERAKKLQQYSDGWFDQNDIYLKSKSVFRDGCLFKTGFLKLFECDGRIQAERTNPFEMYVDELDGLYEKPRSLYQVKWVPKSTLMAKFKKHEEMIGKAETSLLNGTVEVCKVAEAWRLEDRHVVCIDGCILVDEPYKKDYFPFVEWRYEHSLIGFWGEDVVSQLYGIQVEIDKVMRRISDSIERVAVPRVWLNGKTKLAIEQLNGIPGQVVRWLGQMPPIIDTPTAQNPETYNYLNWLIQTGYEEIGLSKMGATSEKPAGLNSGKALRTYEDIQSDRFSNIAQRWDDFFLRVSRMMIDMSADLYKGKKVPLKVPGKKFIETVDWDDISLDNDEYVLRVFSTSLLPTQPSAKLETVSEMVEKGYFPQEKALSLLDFPDIEGMTEEDEKSATEKLFDHQYEVMTKEVKYLPPDTAMNIPLALSFAKPRLLTAMATDMGEAKIDLLSRYVNQLEDMVKDQMEAEQRKQMQMQAEAQQQQQQKQQPPGGNPAAAQMMAAMQGQGMG